MQKFVSPISTENLQISKRGNYLKLIFTAFRFWKRELIFALKIWQWERQNVLIKNADDEIHAFSPLRNMKRIYPILEWRVSFSNSFCWNWRCFAGKKYFLVFFLVAFLKCIFWLIVFFSIHNAWSILNTNFYI